MRPKCKQKLKCNWTDLVIMKSGPSIEILRSRRSLAVVAGMKKRMTTQNWQKSNAKQQQNE